MYINSIVRYFTFLAAILLVTGGLSAQNCIQDTLNAKDEKGRKQGHWVKLDANQKKMYEGYFIDDVPVGKFTYYYDTGVPWSVSVFSQKGTIVYSQMFDAAGKLTGEGKYVNQKKDSLWTFYNNEGKLLSTENYIDGKREGVAKVFYPDGTLLEEKYWKDGLLDGPCKKYFENGQIRYDGNYINGAVEGQLTFYFINGNIHATGLYEDDLKTGIWKYYKKDGSLDHIEEYINGRLQGEDPNVIPKEQVEKEREQYEQNQMEDPFKQQEDPYSGY